MNSTVNEQVPHQYKMKNMLESTKFIRLTPPGDYSKIKLVDLNSGNIYIEEAYSLLKNTNINFISIDKLIGKKIRITSYVEIIN